MSYRKLSASYIYSSQTGFLNNGVLILDKNNRIIELIDTEGHLEEEANLEYYNGILTPGFVNAYDPLDFPQIFELFQDCTGRNAFNQYIFNRKDFSNDQIQESIKYADDELRREGILVVADTSNTLLIHNLHSNLQDIKDFMNLCKNIFWVICPHSIYYLERDYPWSDLHSLFSERICLGTGNLATNHKQSMLEVMYFIQQNNPETQLGDLLKWATINGARALGIDSMIGSFEKGKTPGVNLIERVDMERLKLLSGSGIKVLTI